MEAVLFEGEFLGDTASPVRNYAKVRFFKHVCIFFLTALEPDSYSLGR